MSGTNYINEDEHTDWQDELMPGEEEDQLSFDDDDDGEKPLQPADNCNGSTDTDRGRQQPNKVCATLEQRLQAVVSGIHADIGKTLLDALLLPRAPNENDQSYNERYCDAIACARRVIAREDDDTRERLELMMQMRREAAQYVPRTETTDEFRVRLNRETDYHTFDEVAPKHQSMRCFARPEYLEPTTNGDDITFMIMDMDTTNTLTNRWDVLCRRTDEEGNDYRPNYWSFYVRLFGVTKAGHSVCCYVGGFAPYVYVQVPSGWQVRDCRHFITHCSRQPTLKNFDRSVSNYELVKRKNIYGYTKETEVKMLKISFHSASTRRRFIEFIAGRYDYKDVKDPKTGEMTREKTFKPGKRDAGMPGGFEFWLFDANVTPRMQFVNNTKILPSHWVTLKAGAYERHNAPMLAPDERRARCQIDVDVDFDKVVVDYDRSDIAPFLVESWDIECVRGARDDKFPDARNAADEIIQIGSTVWRFGDEDNLHQSVHCVRPTANVDLATEWDVYSYRSEKDMLDGYLRYTRDHLDPDLRIAFNQYGFDNPYWDERNRRHFPFQGERSRYEQGDVEYGRLNNRRTACRAHFGGSKAHGGRTTHTIRAEGRIDLDVFKYAAEQWKMPRGLDFISEKLLGLHKDDIDYRQINSKYDEGAYDRGIVAKYCRVDTELPLKIIRKRKVLVEMIEQSRLCGVPLNDIFNKKMMARVFALLSREAHDAGYAIPEKPERFVKDERLREYMFGGTPEGAIVLPPDRDFYDVPICTLDFSGLYPSIMRGYRLCYTTLILDPKWLDDPDTTHKCLEIRDPHKPEEPPHKVYWATNVEEPLLYKVLTKLLAARKEAKKAMFAAEQSGDEFSEALYNAKQLALKIICNSAYGFTGALVGPMPCMAITAAVTWYGRNMIIQSKGYVEEHCPGSHIIYGGMFIFLFFFYSYDGQNLTNAHTFICLDTDSIMIDFGRGNDDEAFRASFEVGKRMADEVSKLFPEEVKLEFEKVFMPYILWGKKSYAGILFTDPDKPGAYKKKGIASVRGDKIKFVKKLTDTLVNEMIEDKATDRAKQTLETELRRLINGEVALEDLVIEKKLTKETEMYGGSAESRASVKPKEKKKPEHVVVTEEMQRRCPGQAPAAGSIVSYVLAFDKQTQKRVPVDVAWFRQNPQRFRVHTEHYLTNLIHEMVGKLIDVPRFDPDPYRLFEPFIAQARARNMGSDMTQFVRKLKRDLHAENEDAVGTTRFASKMKRARIKKEEERRLKDEARDRGRDYNAYKEGPSINSFVQKRKHADVRLPLSKRAKDHQQQ